MMHMQMMDSLYLTRGDPACHLQEGLGHTIIKYAGSQLVSCLACLT